MGERTQYAPGTFSWVDLTTTDQDAARAFYGDLFGWQANDMPAGDGIVYSMMQVDGRDVGAISAQPQAQRDAGAPPSWNSYVTVASADDAAARAAELGATVHAPPFDVFDAGRMAVIQDPQGAWLMLWEPKRHVGAGLVNAPGALSWNELATPDAEAASGFYGELFGWSFEPYGSGGQPYLVIRNGETANGGIRQTAPDEPGAGTPFWLAYFAVDALDAAVARVQELGGAVLAPSMDIDVGRIAVVADPQGAPFTLYDGRLDP